MSFFISIDPEHRTTRVGFDGAVTGHDILKGTDALVVHPDYDSTFDQLWILTDADSLSFSPREMTALVAHDRALVESGAMGRVRVGIVVRGEARELAIRLYEHHMRSTGQDIRLFAREEEAEAWLQDVRTARPAGTGSDLE